MSENPWLGQPIEQLRMRVRTANAVAAAGWSRRTVADLLKATRSEVLQWKGAGPAVVLDLLGCLAELGLDAPLLKAPCLTPVVARPAVEERIATALESIAASLAALAGGSQNKPR